MSCYKTLTKNKDYINYHEELIGTLFKDYLTDPKHAHEEMQKVFKAGTARRRRGSRD
ncbi:MAG TPA: hypothetical protein VMW78_08800 [Anaerolineae bacterium]|nr:hypothetical protein [Anaerolineae bacterium]